MTKRCLPGEEKKTPVHKPEHRERTKHHSNGSEAPGPLVSLQQQVGNRAVQRLLAQRGGDGPFKLDDETANCINRERGGGQALDDAIQKRAGAAMGHDFSGVKVHTSPEADELSQELGAKAFTTGRDVFFREGVYDPHSSGGQELIAHELTHVVQQGSGAVGGSGGRMTVNAPGDTFEQEADAIAKTVTSPAAAAEVQRQMPEEEEEIQTKAIQRQVPEEEEEIQMQLEEEEEEPVQMQELEEEEELPE